MRKRLQGRLIAIMASMLCLGACASQQDDVGQGALNIRALSEGEPRAGERQAYQVSLTSQPSDLVAVELTLKSMMASVNQQVLYIDPESWREGQGFELYCVSDPKVKGDQNIEIDLRTLSKDPRYQRLHQKISIVCRERQVVDDSNLAIIMDPPALETFGLGSEAHLHVRLSQKPTAVVNIDFEVSDVSEGHLEASRLIFSPEAWSESQTLVLKGLNDGEADGEQRYVLRARVFSEDARYASLSFRDVPVTNFEADRDLGAEAGKIVLSELSSEPAIEGGEGKLYRLRLDAAPRKDVRFILSSSDAHRLRVSYSQIRIPSLRWDQDYVFAVYCLPDGKVTEDKRIKLSALSRSADKRFNKILNEVEVLCVEGEQKDKPEPEPKPQPEEPVSILLTSTQLSLEEGKTEPVTLRLSSAPTATVKLSFSSSDSQEVSVSPKTLSFSKGNWQTPQNLQITAVSDKRVDADKTSQISVQVSSSDSRYHGLSVPKIEVKSINVDEQSDEPGPTPDPGDSVQFRVMAANITSGNGQSYDEPHGRRIFMALKPDIVLIQEFQVKNGSIRGFVDQVFGSDYHYYQGVGQIPNGVISRFPIKSSGAWKSNTVGNREWDWAVIDLPGPKDLLAVSVHLHTKRHASEMAPLLRQIKQKQAEGNYYVVLGGDFNTKSRSSVSSHLSSLFVTTAPYPVDQNGNDNTNASRKEPYDWVLCDKALCQHEVPVKIGKQSYSKGHVFDSRVYKSHGQLSDVVPVQGGDSGSSNMQHMAVIKDFYIK